MSHFNLLIFSANVTGVHRRKAFNYGFHVAVCERLTELSLKHDPFLVELVRSGVTTKSQLNPFVDIIPASPDYPPVQPPSLKFNHPGLRQNMQRIVKSDSLIFAAKRALRASSNIIKI